MTFVLSRWRRHLYRRHLVTARVKSVPAVTGLSGWLPVLPGGPSALERNVPRPYPSAASGLRSQPRLPDTTKDACQAPGLFLTPFSSELQSVAKKVSFSVLQANQR
ncbi:hypothetical protein V5799_003727 [Amblyomma americanum]|uniref:Uncharacterized protein n=1 Tax=Amblyomma americanum TaxID=6943 RepID=A0AAQ4D852_AMBAM